MKKMNLVFVLVWLLLVVMIPDGNAQPGSSHKSTLGLLVSWDGESYSVAKSSVAEFAPSRDSSDNRTTYSTTIVLERSFPAGRSTWLSWFKDFNEDHQQSKSVEIVPTTGTKAKPEKLIKDGTAEPVSYKITGEGMEVLTIRITNMELNL